MSRAGHSIGIVGVGRAGSSFASALEPRGWKVSLLEHSRTDADTLGALAQSVDVLLLCVPDSQIPQVAAMLESQALNEDVVIAHCSGATTLEALGAARRRGSIHPLVALSGTDPDLLLGAWFAVSGDPLLNEIVRSLGGHVVEVDDSKRSLYHAGAVIASNHLVALMAQVDAVANRVGVPLEAFLDLAAGALGSVGRVGVSRALTGPVSRGDLETVQGHLKALEASGMSSEKEAYIALARRAATLAGRDPDELGSGATGRADADG